MNMGLVSVPNLDYGSALAFCREFETYKWDEENIFDFKKVYNCDPFPMLCVGSKIRKRRIDQKIIIPLPAHTRIRIKSA